MRVVARRFTGSRHSSRRLGWLGAAFIVAVTTVLAVAAVGWNPFANTRTVWAVFDEASGIAEGGAADRDVRVDGVNVGMLGEVKRVGDDVKVELRLEDGAGEIHRDARAELRSHTAFEGSAYVELYPGSPSAPPIGDQAIPKSRTRVYTTLDKALRFLDTDTRTAVQQLARGLAGGLSGEARRGLQRTFRAAPELTKDLAVGARAFRGPRGTEIGGMVRGLARTTAAIARNERHVAPLLRNAQRTFAALDADGGQALGATLDELPGALIELERGSRALRGTLDRLDPLAGELRPGLAAAAPALREARPLLRDLRPALAGTGALLRDLRPAVARTAVAAPATRRLLTALDPTSRMLNAGLLPHLHTRSRLGQKVYLQTMSFLTAVTGVFRAYQTEEQGGTNGPGHYFAFDAQFFTGQASPAPPCSLIGEIRPDLVQPFNKAGLCQR